jgi:large subunit ribosomal protein L15
MLDRLSPKKGARRPPKRVGRGPGSGTGKTSGRGMKGQGKRSAGAAPAFEGGQMPLIRRLPKRGFKNLHRVEVTALNLRNLAGFGDGATVDVAALVARGLVRARASQVKVLADGDVPRNLTLKVHQISAAARAKVEAAGGSVEIIS